MESPFKNPLRYTTSRALASAVQQFYKVKDAELYYVQRRAEILDRCLPDEFGFRHADTIHEWHRNQHLKAHHGV